MWNVFRSTLSPAVIVFALAGAANAQSGNGRFDGGGIL